MQGLPPSGEDTASCTQQRWQDAAPCGQEEGHQTQQTLLQPWRVLQGVGYTRWRPLLGQVWPQHCCRTEAARMQQLQERR